VEGVASYGKVNRKGKKIILEETSTVEEDSSGIAPPIAPQAKAEKVENA
jgi:hypothetical protein